MNGIVGHTACRQLLERELPTVTLLTGPASIGKWTLASHLADHHQVALVDRWLLRDGIGIDTVRLITAFAHRPPVGAFKLFQARIDNASTPALNALLKTLEEPPPRVRFLLVSSRPPPATVASRCTAFTLGLLSVEELRRIYRAEGMTPTRASQAARYGRGQVATGYELDSVDLPKSTVLSLARAISCGDRDLFDQVFKAWDPRASLMLNRLLSECLTGRWQVFTEDDVHGLHHDRKRLLNMVAALGRLPSARPRLRVRAALEPFTSGKGTRV